MKRAMLKIIVVLPLSCFTILTISTGKSQEISSWGIGERFKQLDLREMAL